MTYSDPLILQVHVPGAEPYALGDEIWQQSLPDAIRAEAEIIADHAGPDLLRMSSHATRRALGRTPSRPSPAALTPTRVVRRLAATRAHRVALSGGASQVGLKPLGLEHRGRFSQGHDNHARELRIAEPLGQLAHDAGDMSIGSFDLALIALSGVEQQQGMAGGCRVEHDDPVTGFVDGASKGTKDSDLLGASVHGERRSSSSSARPSASRPTAASSTSAL